MTGALTIWAVLIAGICVRGFLEPDNHNCYSSCYAPAARLWLEGKDCYQTMGGSYRYSPPVTMLFAPLAATPVWLGSLLWRLLNAGAFLGALLWWQRMYAPPTWSSALQALFLLGAVPLTAGNINSGQANPLLAGLMMATVVAAGREQWNLAAAFCAAACWLKAYPIALALLLAATYPRRFAFRFLIALAAGAALPFLTQPPALAVRQFCAWAACLHEDDRTRGDLVTLAYRDLWLLIRALHLPVSHTAYIVIQLLLAGLIAVICAAARWVARWRPGEVLNACLHLGVCWMTLCGPATEAPTYMLVAPTLTWAVLESWRRPWPGWIRGLLLGSCAAFTAALSGCLTTRTAAVTAWGFHPLGASLLLTALGAEYARRLAAPRPASRAETALEGRAA